jgi:hypothetical protein
VATGDPGRVRDQIAFYGSTPAYHPVLELHGWLELGLELNALSKSDRPDKWRQMGELVSDDVVRELAVVADPPDVMSAVEERYRGLVDRFTLPPASV